MNCRKVVGLVSAGEGSDICMSVRNGQGQKRQRNVEGEFVPSTTLEHLSNINIALHVF
jgi:hypothetical protein